MKSKASATTTSSATTQKLIVSASTPLRVFEHDAFDHVRHVLAAVGNRFQQVVDHAQLEDLLDVGLVAEQLLQRGAHHAVGVGLEPVDLLAALQDRGRLLDVGEQADGGQIGRAS